MGAATGSNLGTQDFADSSTPTDGGAPALVQVPLGGYVGTWLGDPGSQYYASWSDHWSAFATVMGGRVPTLVGLPAMPYPTNPDQRAHPSSSTTSETRRGDPAEEHGPRS